MAETSSRSIPTTRVFPVRRPMVLALALWLAAIALAGCRGQVAPSWPGTALTEQHLYMSGGIQVTALDPATGNAIWTYEAEGKTLFTTPPGLVPKANLVLVGDQTGILHALDAETGQPRWQYQDDGYPFIARPVHAEGLLFAPNSSGTLYVLDTQGQVRWTFRTKTPLWAEVVVQDGIAYLVSMDRHLYALQAETGRVLWKKNLGVPMAHGPLFAKGRLYVPTYGGGVKAVDPAQGQVLWTALEGAWIWHTPQYGDEALFVGTMDNRVVALSPETGQVLWEKTVNGAVVARPGWDADQGTVYVAAEDGTLWALDRETGNVKWSRTEDAWKKKLYTEPVTYRDRVLLALHSNPPAIVALNAENGQTLWTYPGEAK